PRARRPGAAAAGPARAASRRPRRPLRRARGPAAGGRPAAGRAAAGPRAAQHGPLRSGAAPRSAGGLAFLSSVRTGVRGDLFRKGFWMSNLKFAGHVGLLLAGVWLLLFGVLLAFPAVQFANWNVVLGLLAFLTGVLVVV